MKKKYILDDLLSMLEDSLTPVAKIKESLKRYLVDFKKIGIDPLVNFDLEKCHSQEAIHCHSQNKKTYIEKNI